jgi:hypothetical protein
MRKNKSITWDRNPFTPYSVGSVALLTEMGKDAEQGFATGKTITKQ